jgi:hypothetical protein
VRLIWCLTRSNKRSAGEIRPDRPEYDEEASELAYRRTDDFLRANLT